MKKHYSEPEMEVVGLSREDMILTSGCDEALPPPIPICGCDSATGVPDDIGCNCHGKPGQEK